VIQHGMSRYDLTDFKWRVIEPLLPNKPRGVPRVDDRRVLNGIFWALRSGAPWRDLPERSGPRTTCYNDGKKGGADHCLGRSRGGLTTKIHVIVDAQGDADRIRELIQNQGATPNIPPKSNRRWKPCFSKRLYRERT
jgi:transposase